MREYREYLRVDDDRPPFWLGLSSLTQFLIIANVAIFLLFIVGVYLVAPYVIGIHRPPAVIADRILEWIGLVPEKAVGSGWVWQFVTYAFIHSPTSILHLLFNMIVLYFFGREVETLYGAKRFLILYFAAAIFAALTYCVISYGQQTVLIGASGAVYAIMVVYALHYPRQKVLFFFLIPLEVWLVVVVLIGLDLTMQITGSPDGIGHMAHLGGAFAGFLFYRFHGFVEAYLSRIDHGIARHERESKEEIEARLDALLEKISRDGMASLSKKERDFLKRASRHYQKKP